MTHFNGKSFLKESDFTAAELMYLIDFAAHLKHLKQNNIPHAYLTGKNIALIFEKNSTRTRAAFTVAANDLGAQPEFLSKDAIHLGHKESLVDTAKVLGSMFDAIEYRGFGQQIVEELAQYSGVPVWNGLTDEWHPTQMLADFLTLKEHFGYLKGLTISYLGDARNNVAHSLLVTSALLGVNISIGAPAELQPSAAIIELAQKFASQTGAKIMISANPVTAVKDADALYTDVWVSMGEEIDIEARIKLLLPYQINQSLLSATGKLNSVVLHCLPAFHDKSTTTGKLLAEKFNVDALEITDEVFQGPHSLVFQEAENRMHAIKAIMAATLGNLFISDELFGGQNV